MLLLYTKLYCLIFCKGSSNYTLPSGKTMIMFRDTVAWKVYMLVFEGHTSPQRRVRQISACLLLIGSGIRLQSTNKLPKKRTKSFQFELAFWARGSPVEECDATSHACSKRSLFISLIILIFLAKLICFLHLQRVNSKYFLSSISF